MIALKIRGATHHFGPPREWDEAVDGKCASLWVRRDGDTLATAWEPTPDELALLNAGGVVVLTVKGAQVPVRLTVEQPAG